VLLRRTDPHANNTARLLGLLLKDHLKQDLKQDLAAAWP
jgi:hypothetical protein